ncbi:hypothetical protein A2U01_0114346, partial [Trifolium medium]|nr:hypothetical protein [Trifolium medium]
PQKVCLRGSVSSAE